MQRKILAVSLFLWMSILANSSYYPILGIETSALTFVEPYWYEFQEFRVTPTDSWIPFYSTTDVPFSLPLRGFTAHSRTMFLDLGAHHWFSKWVTDQWGDSVSNYETTFSEQMTIGQKTQLLHYLFNAMLSRLSTGLSVNYAQNLLPPYKAYVPLVVYDELSTHGYAQSNLSEWIIRPDIIQNALNDAFPFLEWQCELFWYTDMNATTIKQIIENNANDYQLNIGSSFINDMDDILYDITAPTLPADNDLYIPSLVLLLANKTLYYGSTPIGGLGQISSSHSEIFSWSINGRNQYSYFYGGDAALPRDSLTTTIIHELGHCVGLPHPHAYGWFLDTISETTMGYYSRTTQFDQFDKDLVMNSIVLQLWGRYSDEISYLKAKTPSSEQLAVLNQLEYNLSALIPDYIINFDAQALKNLFTNTENQIAGIASAMVVIRKASNFSVKSPLLPVQIDFVVGGGIGSEEMVSSALEATLGGSNELSVAYSTTLPKPTYQLSAEVTSGSAEFQLGLKNALENLLVNDSTSDFNPSLIPPEAWTSYPRNHIFQTINGSSINGYAAEEWLVANPVTLNHSLQLHYRFYIFNSRLLTTQIITIIVEPSTQSITSGFASFELFTTLFTATVIYKSIIKKKWLN